MVPLTTQELRQLWQRLDFSSRNQMQLLLLHSAKPLTAQQTSTLYKRWLDSLTHQELSLVKYDPVPRVILLMLQLMHSDGIHISYSSR